MVIAAYCLAGAIVVLCAFIKGHRARSSKASVEEALEQLRAELEKDSPRLLCLMVRSPSKLVSRDVQKAIWDFQSFETKDWNDLETITVTKKRNATS